VRASIVQPNESPIITWSIKVTKRAYFRSRCFDTGTDLKNVAKIVADVSDPDSLHAMAKQCDVVLNCVGPYLLWGGEEVVRACVEEGTHHLDLSGEPQFLEMVQLKYNSRAEESGSYIIGACG
jgi:short subunit dehydrogenase-like uncharacterized protein